jgi:hypothetical protein
MGEQGSSSDREAVKKVVSVSCQLSVEEARRVGGEPLNVVGDVLIVSAFVVSLFLARQA